LACSIGHTTYKMLFLALIAKLLSTSLLSLKFCL
jgi:hypothetical protein